MIFLRVTIIFSLMWSSGVSAEQKLSPCTIDDDRYAMFWDNYYKPEEAYDFGLNIQDLVRDKNLPGLFELINGELANGPRKKYISNKQLSEIFDKSWQESVLYEKPSCRPVGWRGFMLGNGLIWYNFSQGRWQITSMNGWNEESFNVTELPISWDIDGVTLSHQCFATVWVSADNFEEYEDKFDITNSVDFRKSIGRYLGKEVTTLEPVVPSWSDDGSTISLVKFINQCSINKSEITINGRNVENRICEGEYSCTEYEYEILSEITTKQCKALAPHVQGQCRKSYMLKVGDYSGGTIGWQYQYIIYGLFTLKDGREAIVPLIIHTTENDARNYLDDVQE